MHASIFPTYIESHPMIYDDLPSPVVIRQICDTILRGPDCGDLRLLATCLKDRDEQIERLKKQLEAAQLIACPHCGARLNDSAEQIAGEHTQPNSSKFPVKEQFRALVPGDVKIDEAERFLLGRDVLPAR